MPSPDKSDMTYPQGKRRLLVAIGNSGRSDDGLGWQFADLMEKHDLFPGEVIYRYQLQVEDSEMISRFDEVLFVDACKNVLPKGFDFSRLQPSYAFAFTTHALEPATILGLCEALYGASPECRVMRIQGREWELKTGLSALARNNLQKAINSMVKIRFPENEQALN